MAYIPFLNNAYFSAKVGIGTDSPSEKLEVQGGNIKIETTTNTDAKLILNSYSSALGSAYQWELVSASSSQNYNFQIREAGQAYVTVDSSVNGNAGYVGIGTTSPIAKLDIEGDLQIVSANISFQENTDVDAAAAEVIATVNTGSFTGAFFDYTCVSGSNARVGTVMAVNVAGSVEYTDNSTNSIGVTSGVTLSVDISGANMRLLAATTTDNWSIKSLVRTL